jgi:hypothetical protein
MKPDSFWNSDFVLGLSKWVDHHSTVLAVLITVIVLVLVPKTWKTASERFEKRHVQLLWMIVILMLLAIPFVFFWLSR